MRPALEDALPDLARYREQAQAILSEYALSDEDGKFFASAVYGSQALDLLKEMFGQAGTREP